MIKFFMSIKDYQINRVKMFQLAMHSNRGLFNVPVATTNLGPMPWVITYYQNVGDHRSLFLYFKFQTLSPLSKKFYKISIKVIFIVEIIHHALGLVLSSPSPFCLFVNHIVSCSTTINHVFPYPFLSYFELSSSPPCAYIL